MSPIFYVNARPHIGHLYTAVLCDAAARHSRQKGSSVLFTIGTDEHGLKIQKRAIENKQTPQQMCDQNSQVFRDLFARAQISNDHFIRTTDSNHKEAVSEFWNALSHRITEGSHAGFYSTNEETFVMEKDLIREGNVYKTQAGEVCESVEENNYVFNILQEDKEIVKQWAQSAVVPAAIKNKCFDDLEKQRLQISVSRPYERLQWGIRVPRDPKQTIYVWLDALANYLTVLGYPKSHDASNITRTVHIIGKDITKFHAVYYPLFLIAAGLPLPEKTVSHGHWLKDNMKMSKSLGNVTCPFELLDKFCADSVRTYFLAEGPQESDRNFDEKILKEVHNNFLANSFVNLVNRCLQPKFIDKLPKQVTFTGPMFEQVAQEINTLAMEADQQMQQLEFQPAFLKIQKIVVIANRNLGDHEFWKLADSGAPSDILLLQNLFYFTFECARLASTLLHPYCPDTANKMKQLLNESCCSLQIDFSKTYQLDYSKKVFLPKVL